MLAHRSWYGLKVSRDTAWNQLRCSVEHCTISVFQQPSTCNTHVLQVCYKQSTTLNIVMAASRTRSFRLSNELMEVAELRSKALGYPDPNALVKALLRYDAYCQGDHPLTGPWAKLSPVEQDKIDKKCLDLVERGKGERGCYWKHMLEKLKDGGKSVLQAFYEL